jgi:DNA-binding response OmpR family regulator
VDGAELGSGPMEKYFAGSRILIVEDDSPLRLLLAEFLVDEGFDITEAQTGDQAIVILAQQGTFDLVFTDISLPGRADGNDVAATAKQRNHDTPVLYSSSCPELLTNRIEPGDAFMVKPCKLAEVSSVVQELLSRTSRRRLPV